MMMWCHHVRGMSGSLRKISVDVKQMSYRDAPFFCAPTLRGSESGPKRRLRPFEKPFPLVLQRLARGPLHHVPRELLALLGPGEDGDAELRAWVVTFPRGLAKVFGVWTRYPEKNASRLGTAAYECRASMCTYSEREHRTGTDDPPSKMCPPRPGPNTRTPAASARRRSRAPRRGAARRACSGP